MEHHRLDPYPIPKDKTSLCINEPWLIDKSLLEYPPRREPDEKGGQCPHLCSYGSEQSCNSA